MAEKNSKPLPSVKRRPLSSDPAGWADFAAPAGERAFPLLVRPRVAGIEAATWAAAQRSVLLTRLQHHGALLLRGFAVDTPEALARFVCAIDGQPLAYEERSSPRSHLVEHVYTSTDHPPDEPIFLHNEQSYNTNFPLHLYFACLTPATQGGATPLADSRRVYRRIPPAIRDAFLARGYLYVRNFSERLGLSWQVAFQTRDRHDVEAYCQRHEIAFEWRDDNVLRTRQKRRVAGLHPATGEPVWFNHLTFFHISTLPPPIGQALRGELGEDNLPNNTYYGDGQPIEPEVTAHLREIYHAETVEFPWQAGDLLLIDNMLSAHGRTPYTGARRVVAAMACAFPWEQVAPIPASVSQQEGGPRVNPQ